MDNIIYNVGNYQSVIMIALLIAIFIALLTLIIAIIISFKITRNKKDNEVVNDQSVQDIIGTLIPDLEIDKKNIQKIADQINREMQPSSINQFEKEQEEKAIISYQELVKNIEHQQEQLSNVVKVELPSSPEPIVQVQPVTNEVVVNPDAINNAKDYLQNLKDLKSKLK